MSPDIVFEDSRLEYLLELFDKEVDEEGFIVEAGSGERVISRSGKEIKKGDLGVIAHGSEVFIEDNFTEIVDYLSDKKQSVES